MLSQAPISTALEQIVNQILTSRKITRQDQSNLLNLTTLTPQENALINRIFDHLRSGRIRVVD